MEQDFDFPLRIKGKKQKREPLQIKSDSRFIVQRKKFNLQSRVAEQNPR